MVILEEDYAAIKKELEELRTEVAELRQKSVVNPNYLSLWLVFVKALDQAANGKGKDRHAYGEPYEEQKICTINKWLGSADGNIYQAIKKAVESKRMPHDRAVSEILGAINYLAAAIIVMESLKSRGEEAEILAARELKDIEAGNGHEKRKRASYDPRALEYSSLFEDAKAAGLSVEAYVALKNRGLENGAVVNSDGDVVPAVKCPFAGGRWEGGKLTGRHGQDCACDDTGVIEDTEGELSSAWLVSAAEVLKLPDQINLYSKVTDIFNSSRVALPLLKEIDHRTRMRDEDGHYKAAGKEARNKEHVDP